MRLAFSGKWLLSVACLGLVVSVLWGQGPPNAGERLLRDNLPPEVPNHVIDQAVHPPAQQPPQIDPKVFERIGPLYNPTPKDESFWGWCREHWLTIMITMGVGAGAGGIFKSRK
jgi:hypothetical protein